jgi:predicted SprT family Zn-dependent metalloprotease
MRYVTQPPFDPWSPNNDCELMGWGGKTRWKDKDYENHPGNPDLKERQFTRIQFACERCQQKYTVSGEFAGKRTKCRRCDAALIVPDET